MSKCKNLRDCLVKSQEQNKNMVEHYLLFHPNPLDKVRRFLQELENDLSESSEICEHMPDDPDVTECHVCGFKVKE